MPSDTSKTVKKKTKSTRKRKKVAKRAAKEPASGGEEFAESATQVSIDVAKDAIGAEVGARLPLAAAQEATAVAELEVADSSGASTSGAGTQAKQSNTSKARKKSTKKRSRKKASSKATARADESDTSAGGDDAGADSGKESPPARAREVAIEPSDEVQRQQLDMLISHLYASTEKPRQNSYRRRPLVEGHLHRAQSECLFARSQVAKPGLCEILGADNSVTGAVTVGKNPLRACLDL